MSIIYSYPTTQPTLDDLLIGTDVGDDNATKSFSVQSLVSLINASQNNGIITDVTISTSDIFITANKTSVIGDPAIAYTLGLAATGTPSATTFLRGDNKWVVPTVSAGIGVFNNSNTVTTDVSSFNFTGAGVVPSSDAQGNVTLSIPGAINAVESIIASTGIGLSSETGNVIVTNTGITSLIEGGGIAIATDVNGQATLTVATQSGTVTNVGAGDGLVITNSDAASPIIALDYIGADTYITQPTVAVPLAADLMPFHSVAGNTVNKVAFGDIQASTLALVNTSITAANADAITNTYDKSQQAASPNNRTVGAVPATQIVTCSAAEYTAMDSAGELVDSFIYLTTASAAPQNTVNFTINSGTISASGGCSVTTSTTVNNNAVLTVTGAVGSSYTVRTTITASGSGCVFSGTNPQILTGTIPAGSTAAVTQNLTGSVSVPAPPGNVNDTLSITNNIGGPGSGYTITSNSPLNGPQGTSFSTSAFGLTATANTGYEFSGGATTLGGTYNQSTSTYGSNTTTGSFPVGSSVSLITYNVSYSVSTSNITNNTGNSFNYVISGGTFSGSAASGGPIAVPSGSPVTVTARIVPTGTDIISPDPTTATVTVASVTSDQTITVSPTGVIDVSTGNASMTLASNGIIGPANGYTVSYTANSSPYTIGNAVSGAVGSSVAFSTSITLNPTGYTLITPLTAVYSNGNSVTIPDTTEVTLAGEVMATRGQGVYNSTSEVSSSEACQLGNPIETVFLSVGGSNIYAGITCYTSATGSGTVGDGYYKANNNNSWMRITGGNGYVQSTGSCS